MTSEAENYAGVPSMHINPPGAGEGWEFLIPNS